MCNKCYVREATKKGYAVAYEGDGINLALPSSTTRRGRVNRGGVNTLDTSCNQGTLVGKRIRRLTPRECFALQGFRKEDCDMLSFTTKTVEVIGGTSKCSVKLKVATEKQRQKDLETYVLCTTKECQDGEVLPSIKTLKDSSVKWLTTNVSIAITKLESVEPKECAASIIKCSEIMEMPCSLTERLKSYHMAIIDLSEKTGQNQTTDGYLKITLEEDCSPQKLSIISTLIKLIIESKIYGCIVQKANIRGNIAITTASENHWQVMKLSNLRMEYITRRLSDSALYKMAGNSICVPVLQAIFHSMQEQGLLCPR